MRALQSWRFAVPIFVLFVLTGCALAPSAPIQQARATSEPAFSAPAPGGRGADGEVVLVYWQEISLLKPYLANGIKDYHAASLVLEPLIKGLKTRGFCFRTLREHPDYAAWTRKP